MYDYIHGDHIYRDDMCVSDEYLDERWWYIDGAPGYMISDCGRVWSTASQQFLKLKTMDREGHLGVCLSINGRPRYEYIHRLMAKAFIPNPNNYPVVRHLNDEPHDNHLENLRWGTQRDNIHDAIRNGKSHRVTPEEREIGLAKTRKPVRATNIKTGNSVVYMSQTDAARILGLQQANVWKVLNGERAHAGGYFFEYLGGDE